MLSNKAIVVLIGNNGTIISKHDDSGVSSEFIEKFTDEQKPNLTTFFTKHKNHQVYILLDTIDQTYKKKTYPAMRSFDLDKIAKRDLSSDGDKEGLKNYIILKNQKQSTKKNIIKRNEITNNKVDCLFITSSKSENISNWLNFIYELPNRLIGIYMLPVESYNLFKKLVEKVGQSKSKEVLKIKENNIFCLVIQTKTGGARQIVFSNSSIVFTRVVNYNFDEPNFAEKYSQDIYSTFEYLKRLYIDLTLHEFEVVNILPEKALPLIMSKKNIELNISNYTVKSTLDILKYNKLKIEDDYVDNIVSSVFVNSKKILKFTNQRIRSNEVIHFLKIGSYIINAILLVFLIGISSLVFVTNQSIGSKIDKSQDQKVLALNEFAKIKKSSLQGNFMEGDKEISLERVGDMGRVEQALGNLEHNFVKTYSMMKFSNNFDLKFNFFSYDLISFNPYSVSNKAIEIQLKLIGKLNNKSGDIENLFTEFDNYVVEMKKNLPGYEIKYNELPRNIDFNQKYFSFPVEFRIINKPNEN